MLHSSSYPEQTPQTQQDESYVGRAQTGQEGSRPGGRTASDSPSNVASQPGDVGDGMTINLTAPLAAAVARQEKSSPSKLESGPKGV